VADIIYPRENPVKLEIAGKLKQMLYFDTMADFSNLPGLDRVAPGSDAYCISTQDVYILSGAGVWEVQ
jgi:hypothetical protein